MNPEKLKQLQNEVRIGGKVSNVFTMVCGVAEVGNSIRVVLCNL